jgi:DNA helicase II / ATP-dependent DNA helicase PcrA
LLEILSGVGQKTAKEIGDACVNNNQNFRAMFHAGVSPAWLSTRGTSAVQRVIAVVQSLAGWSMADTLAARLTGIGGLLSTYVFATGTKATPRIQAWTALAAALPPQMTLDELALFLGASTESDQEAILKTIATRIAAGQTAPLPQVPKKIRILTMHGSKGLTGSVVFIPSAEQGILPNSKALQATGLLIERRRLFYVAVTRSRACCIISHCAARTGFQAQAVVNRPNASLHRSQFLNEMVIPDVPRASGLTLAEAWAIVSEVSNL